MTDLAQRQTDVYRIFDLSGELAYVGISATIMQRLHGHVKASPWFPKRAIVHVETYKDREAALQAESWAIAHEHPTHNLEPGVKHLRPAEFVAKPISPPRAFAMTGKLRWTND